MPNWVFCTTSIEGPEEDMTRFLKAAKTGRRFINQEISYEDWGSFTDLQLEVLMEEAHNLQTAESQNLFSFHSLYPVPLAVQVMPYDPAVMREFVEKNPVIRAFCEKHKSDSSGYEWECNNWGVKWGDCHTEILGMKDNYLSLYFETPWSAPHKFWKKVSKDYPTLSIKMEYREEMEHFAGEAFYQAGQMYYDEWEPEKEEMEEDD